MVVSPSSGGTSSSAAPRRESSQQGDGRVRRLDASSDHHHRHRSRFWPTASSGSATCPNEHLIWNLGLFTDWLSEGAGLLHLRHQVAAASPGCRCLGQSGTLLHLGGDASATASRRTAQLQLRSRPEANAAPTSSTPASSGDVGDTCGAWRRTTGPGPGCSARSTTSQKASSPPRPAIRSFTAATSSSTWHITGETRSYNTAAASSAASHRPRRCSRAGQGRGRRGCGSPTATATAGPSRAAPSGGSRPWSTGTSPTTTRLEFAYGYGTLDRFDLKGATQFFQTRLQLEF